MEIMEDGDSDASVNAVNLNSPEVVESKNQQFLPDTEDGVSRLMTQDSNGKTSNLSKVIKKKEAARRVSFPDDDKIISGYGEPRNPWAQAKTTSTEELIQAYTQSCQHWGVKPITKLLIQLQEMKDFSVRSPSLTLKGEKLDSKVVETLEAVFKRVQFVTMDLEATNLDDDASAALFDMIEYYESAVHVLVGFNKNLGTRGWQAAAHMMRKMSCLRLFDGHSVPLTDQAVPFVGRALRLSSTLVTLHLECACLSGRPMLLIVAALRMNHTLRELFLADNQLVSTDALQISSLLKFNTTLQLLDIRNNLIQDAGLCHISTGLASQPGNNGLQTLVLWNNQLSHQSMLKLSMALRHSNSLSTLNLGQNVLGDDGAARLKDGLLQNRSLLRLGMVGTKLTCEGAIALAEFLAESSRIVRLDLRNNDIQVGGLMALSLAFKINHSLLRLDIDKPKETLKELAEKQASLLTNIVEYANRNKQKALQKALCVQMERQRKSEEEKRAGLRYMDMTHSAINVGASTSQNNSNNKPPQGGADNSPSTSRLLHSTSADDSPFNSPEFLPTNSVSYHQVTPVMFSSSEMHKRAEKAKIESGLSEEVTITSSAETSVTEANTTTSQENTICVARERDTTPVSNTSSQVFTEDSIHVEHLTDTNRVENIEKTTSQLNITVSKHTSDTVVAEKASHSGVPAEHLTNPKSVETHELDQSGDVIASESTNTMSSDNISEKTIPHHDASDEGGDVMQMTSDKASTGRFTVRMIGDAIVTPSWKNSDLALLVDEGEECNVTISHMELSKFPTD